MTEDIFTYITTMTRGQPESASCRAAHAVLLEGMSQAEAAQRFAISRVAVAKSVRRYREAAAEGLRVFAQLLGENRVLSGVAVKSLILGMNETNGKNKVLS
ncbi:helix-turn-helix domain-containing protein [Vogesella sp. XCS3]|uniref:helix-turn-helix domain-containing protein n=1 Tax=Vogesella sp. XCS3 TaxID=2877939 RepID=UPI001D0B36E6|nr:helix-turn-helix domain-containing protein [Vogesella sp. XCS3]UDM18894.1 helix-turn-helix domain-containing protein [Vogesella sp. XCS3]